MSDDSASHEPGVFLDWDERRSRISREMGKSEVQGDRSKAKDVGLFVRETEPPVLVSKFPDV